MSPRPQDDPSCPPILFVLTIGGNKACDSCRQLKAKCDESKPCKTCRERNIQCVFRDPQPKQ